MSRKKRHTPSVNDLRPFEQTAVLTTLAQRDDAVGEVVREEIERLLTNVDPDGVADEVQLDLQLIDVDTIFTRSGRHRNGYTAPEEAVWQVLEETLKPYLERMKWYHAAGCDEPCDAYALGVLRGLCDFHHDIEAEWKQHWSEDVREMFGWVLQAWEERRKGTADRQAIRDQLATSRPRWQRDYT